MCDEIRAKSVQFSKPINGVLHVNVSSRETLSIFKYCRIIKTKIVRNAARMKIIDEFNNNFCILLNCYSCFL